MPPRLSEAEIGKLRVLYEESPLSIPALTRETGHSHRTIYWYASRYGWKSRAARRAPRLPRIEIRALYEDTIVPVIEIARLAGVAVQTIHVWAAKEGWEPRSSRLRGLGVPADAIANLPAAVSAARKRAERVQRSRTIRASGQGMQRLLQVARKHSRGLKRAARERAKKGGTYKRIWHSHEELMRMGLHGTARVYVRRPDPPLDPPLPPSHRRHESE
jgi:hypothetical protein